MSLSEGIVCGGRRQASRPRLFFFLSCPRNPPEAIFIALVGLARWRSRYTSRIASILSPAATTDSYISDTFQGTQSPTTDLSDCSSTGRPASCIFLYLIIEEPLLWSSFLVSRIPTKLFTCSWIPRSSVSDKVSHSSHHHLYTSLSLRYLCLTAT